MIGHRIKVWLVCLLVPFVAAAAEDSTEDLFFDSQGVAIHYVVEGIGDPIVLVHGFTSSIETNWRLNGIIDKLAAEFKVIALDARGHGKSGKPHDPTAYGDRMVSDVVALLDHLEIEKAHVVGYSMGGFITLKLATTHPDRLLSAVLGGAGWRQPGADDGMSELADSLEQGRGLAPLIVALTPAGQPLPNEQQMTMINQMILAQNDPLALAAVIRGIEGLEVTREDLDGIGIPLLAIVGEIDPLREGVDALKAAVPELEVVVLEGKDHMSAVGDPGLVDAMRDFFIRLCQCA